MIPFYVAFHTFIRTSASSHLSISLQWLLGDKSQTRSSEPVRSVSSTWCVCILGVFVCVNGRRGFSKAALIHHC